MYIISLLINNKILESKIVDIVILIYILEKKDIIEVNC